MLDLGPLEGALDIGRSPEDAHEVETGPAPPSSKSAPGLAPSSSDPDDPESRIRRLLDEGQAAFDGGELQRAIDAWSRIFLVDVDHAEASERIERARQLKAERERRLDEMLHDALRARGAGRLDEAKETFEQILALEPTHLAARDYLDQLERGEIAPPEPAPATEEEATAGGRVERTRGRAGNFPRVAGVAKARRVVYWAAAGVAVLVLGLGWFLYSNRGRLFPNAGEAASESPSATPLSPLGQAQELHDAGKTAEALAILRQIPPASPDKARARELLAEWQRAPGDSEAATGADIAAGSEDAVLLASAERAAFLERARRSYGSREYFEAARAFRAAERLAPLAGPDADLYVDAREQLLPIAPQIDLFQQREWEMVLGPLWRRLEDDSSNRDVRRILADAYYNLGVRELRRGDPGAARDYLRELLDLAGEDVMALRLLRFAEGYTQQPRDLLYEIFVGELEYRT
jgi:tetratricopeptide (TPR) repeat protein